MRTFWLAVVGVVLLGSASQAQDPLWQRLFSRWRDDSDSGVSHANEAPKLPPSLGMPTTNTPAPANAANPPPGNGLYSKPYNSYPPAPGLGAPPLAGPLPLAGPPPAAHAPPQPAPAGQDCDCDQGAVSGHHLARFMQWLCYRPIRGGCAKGPACLACPPIYLYVLHECQEGHCHTLPPCEKSCNFGRCASPRPRLLGESCSGCSACQKQ
jgi:hypothetical protein